MGKLVVVVQCHLIMNRCSGYNCMNSFYQKQGPFAVYDENARYMPITCGGCCGAELAGKLEDLTHHLQRSNEQKEDVVVHLASCVCSDNYHRPPCPHLDYLTEIVEKKAILLCWGLIFPREPLKNGKLVYINHFNTIVKTPCLLKK